MFLNTLNVGEFQIQGWCTDIGEEKTASTRSQNSIPRKQKTNNRLFVRTFLQPLPKMESHYCWKSTSKFLYILNT